MATSADASAGGGSGARRDHHCKRVSLAYSGKIRSRWIPIVLSINARLKRECAAALAMGAIFVIAVPTASVAPRTRSRRAIPSSCAWLIFARSISFGKSTANSCGGTYGHFG